MPKGAKAPAPVADDASANLPAVVEESAARAIASYKKRKEAVPETPALTYTMSEPDSKGAITARISVDHPDAATGYQMISDAIGTGDMAFTYGFLLDVAAIGSKPDGSSDMERANYAISIVKGIKPRNQLEAMLATQMAAIHMATVKAASNLSRAQTAKAFAMYETSINKLSRTFTTQMDALKRHRSKGSNQRIVVERVNVSEGGQAIVGAVSQRTGDGGDE